MLKAYNKFKFFNVSGREGQTYTGTLGAFVEDVESKEVFVLSCDHVMKGAEGDAIVQPSHHDHVRKLRSHLWAYIRESPKQLRKDLTDEMKSLEKKHKDENQLTKDEIRDEFVKCRQKTKDHFQDHFSENSTECKCCRKPPCRKNCKMCKKCEEEALESYEQQFLAICEELPRNIATYTDGVRGNVEGINREEGEFYVDAAIAKLEDSEVEELRNNGTVQLQSVLMNMKDGCSPLNTNNLDHETKIFKCGRTTSTTDGFFEIHAVLKGRGNPFMRRGCNEDRQLLFDVTQPQETPPPDHVEQVGHQSKVNSKMIIN